METIIREEKIVYDEKMLSWFGPKSFFGKLLLLIHQMLS
jgi:hypothetical protein